MEYKVAEYKKGSENGLIISVGESFKEAKEIADKVKAGYEREVTSEVDGRTVRVYSSVGNP